MFFIPFIFCFPFLIAFGGWAFFPSPSFLPPPPFFNFCFCFTLLLCFSVLFGLRIFLYLNLCFTLLSFCLLPTPRPSFLLRFFSLSFCFSRLFLARGTRASPGRRGSVALRGATPGGPGPARGGRGCGRQQISGAPAAHKKGGRQPAPSLPAAAGCTMRSWRPCSGPATAVSGVEGGVGGGFRPLFSFFVRFGLFFVCVGFFVCLFCFFFCHLPLPAFVV